MSVMLFLRGSLALIWPKTRLLISFRASISCVSPLTSRASLTAANTTFIALVNIICKMLFALMSYVT